MLAFDLLSDVGKLSELQREKQGKKLALCPLVCQEGSDAGKPIKWLMDLGMETDQS
jgi:hypothetical protein